MSKELENVLRFAALIAVFLLIMAVALGRIRKLEKELELYKNAPADTVYVIKTDTTLIAEPKIEYRYIKEKEYITITDSLIVVDTIMKFIQLPREYLVYKDTNYRAVVSGVQPRLDTIETYQKTVTQTITKYVPQKPKTFAPFLEGGVSVNAKDNKEVMGEAGAGVWVKGKFGVAAEWKRNFQTKENYVGGKVFVRL